uniref:Uncharacterized protein n=1 Tax=Tetranychus urticae TaxID=32264 RepID=T1KND9_TETUR
MENANTQLTLRSSRRNNQASQQQQQSNEQPVQESSQQLVRVRDQCSEWGCRTTCWAIDPEGNIQEAVVFNPARVAGWI